MKIPLGDVSKAIEKSLERRTCDVCAQQALPEEKPHQVCGRCGGRRYCSPSCQLHDWPRHKVRCAKRPSAGPSKEPLRTKADRYHDAKVRADEQATAMENLLRAGEHENDGFLSIFLSDQDSTPQAIKDLAMTGLRERIASGELSSHVAGIICYLRLMFLSSEGATEPFTDKVCMNLRIKFKLDEAMFLRQGAALNTFLDFNVVAAKVPPEAKAALAAMSFPNKIKVCVAWAT